MAVPEVAGDRNTPQPASSHHLLNERPFRWGCRVQATLPVGNRRAASVMRSKSSAPLADRHSPMMKGAGDQEHVPTPAFYAMIALPPTERGEEAAAQPIKRVPDTAGPGGIFANVITYY